MYDLKKLGSACKSVRRRAGFTQSQVAACVGCSKSSVSWFENGRNNNAAILLWYLQHGLEMEDLELS